MWAVTSETAFGDPADSPRRFLTVQSAADITPPQVSIGPFAELGNVAFHASGFIFWARDVDQPRDEVMVGVVDVSFEDYWDNLADAPLETYQKMGIFQDLDMIYTSEYEWVRMYGPFTRESMEGALEEVAPWHLINGKGYLNADRWFLAKPAYATRRRAEHLCKPFSGYGMSFDEGDVSDRARTPLSAHWRIVSKGHRGQSIEVGGNFGPLVDVIHGVRELRNQQGLEYIAKVGTKLLRGVVHIS